MTNEELELLRIKLKTGEYSGVDIMSAWVALDELKRLRAALEWISENGPDDAYELREKAREALGE